MSADMDIKKEEMGGWVTPAVESPLPGLLPCLGWQVDPNPVLALSVNLQIGPPPDPFKLVFCDQVSWWLDKDSGVFTYFLAILSGYDTPFMIFVS